MHSGEARTQCRDAASVHTVFHRILWKLFVDLCGVFAAITFLAAAAPAAARELPESRSLRIPPYALAADPFTDVPELPTINEEIEVRARPMDTEWLTAKMEWWLAEDDLIWGSAPPIAFGAPTLYDMQAHRPHATPPMNLTPLFGWAIDQLSRKK